MSIHAGKFKKIGRRIAKLRSNELKESKTWARRRNTAERWAWMLYHEFLRDEVVIRAQSLAFLMVFSLLPLIAGAFFIFTFLAQFGMVQDALQHMVSAFLNTIPVDHRAFINDYILHFKDAYLANLTKKSSSVGVFALLILAWIGLQTFNNIEATLNYIWSADRARPFIEKVRNFIVVAVVGPIVLTGGFSVPIILHRFPVTRFFFQQFPLLNVLLNHVIPLLLVFGVFLMVYRYVPVRRVWWRSAFWGAVFATVTMEITNGFMRLYFAFGTVSAYGKAAAVPLMGFWIYLLWIVVILGAEVSFLIQNGRDISDSHEEEPLLSDGLCLIALLIELRCAYLGGTAPIAFDILCEKAEVDRRTARKIVPYLQRANFVVECAMPPPGSEEGHFALAQDLEALSLEKILADYYAPTAITGNRGIDKLWRKSLAHWLSFFEKSRMADLAK